MDYEVSLHCSNGCLRNSSVFINVLIIQGIYRIFHRGSCHDISIIMRSYCHKIPITSVVLSNGSLWHFIGGREGRMTSLSMVLTIHDVITSQKILRYTFRYWLIICRIVFDIDAAMYKHYWDEISGRLQLEWFERVTIIE